MKLWIATDLDRTLFCRTWRQEESVAATWREQDGSRIPSSWMPRDTHAMLRALWPHFAIVPVTARDIDAFRRVELPGLAWHGPSVVCNGAAIIDAGGAPDPRWTDLMAGELSRWSRTLEEIRRQSVEALRRAEPAVEIRPRFVHDATGGAAYLVVKAEERLWKAPRVVSALDALDLAGCTWSVMGTELQFLPPVVSKQRALAEVATRWFEGHAPTLAMGDMRSDLGFMRMASWMAAPRGSDLDEAWP